MIDPTPGNRRRRGALLVLALAAAWPASRPMIASDGDDFVDTVDVEVRGRDTVLGTVRPPEERESFLIRLPKGAKLKATVKATGPAAPQPVVEIMDPDGRVLGTTAAKARKTPKVLVADSGMHRVRLCGDGLLDGDYKLKVRANLPKAAKGESEVDVAPGEEGTFTFGAAAGTTAKITVSAARRSDLRPAIVEITGPEDFSFAPPAPDTPGKRHKVRDVLLPADGDYTVRLRNDGDAPGGWKAKARLNSPKAQKTTIEITDEVLEGEFAGEQAVFARSIDDEGGVVDPGDDVLDLLGVSVEVPAGAVSEPTLFTIAESDPFFVDDDLYEGGTTFELGPAGIEFAEDVTVTVPFDPQAFDDPGDEVQVAIRDSETGEVQVVTGTVDVDAETITFQTPHFSGFQAISPRPRPLRGGFVELELRGDVTSRFGGSVSFALNPIVGQPGPRSGNAVMRSLDRYGLRVGLDQEGGVALGEIRDEAVQTGTAQAGLDLSLRIGQEVVTYERGRSPDVVLRGDLDESDGVVSVILRRVKGRPTQGALTGRWHAFVLEHAASSIDRTSVSVATVGQRFELTVQADGRAVVGDFDEWVSRGTYPDGPSETTRNRKGPKPGSLRPQGPFARLTLPVGLAGGAPFIDLHAVVRGDALVGVIGATTGDPRAIEGVMTRLVMLVRAGSGGSEALLDGRSRFLSLDAGFSPAQGAALLSPELGVVDAFVVHDGKGRLSRSGFVRLLRHSTTGAPQQGLQPLEPAIGKPPAYAIDKDLLYREDAFPGAGAVFRRRGLYVVTRFSGDRIALGFGLPTRPAE